MASRHGQIKTTKSTSIIDDSHAGPPTLGRGLGPYKPKLGNFRLSRGDDIFQLVNATTEPALAKRRSHASPISKPSAARSAIPEDRWRRAEKPIEGLADRRVRSCATQDTSPASATEEDSCVSAIEDDSHGTSEDVFDDVPVTPITTPATSPTIHAVDKDLEALFSLDGNHPELSQLPPPQKVPHKVPSVSPQRERVHYDHGSVHKNQTEAPTPSTGPHELSAQPLSPQQELERWHRRKLSKLAINPRTSSVAEPLVLPWDTCGDYTLGIPPLVPTPTRNARWATSIEPLYCVDKPTQLAIIKAWLDEGVRDDDAMRAEFVACKEPIHVFVDMSNIIIGFYDALKTQRGMSPNERIVAPAFFFEGFASCLERFRPCAKRVLATSLGAGATTPEHLCNAEALGYEMNVLQRVKGSKKELQLQLQRNASYQGHGRGQGKQQQQQQQQQTLGAMTVYMPQDCSDGNGNGEWSSSGNHGHGHGHAHGHGPPQNHGFREQGVDEILHLKMLESLLETERPATMVLATGDAAAAEFSGGFRRYVVRALERGWHVEVVGWSANMSSAWFDRDLLRSWGPRFRVCCLDGVVEELMAGYHRG